MCAEAYATFAHPAVVPLVQIDDDHFVEELFHGPTLAFKDVALQLVGRLFEHVLSQQGRRVTIVGATSGDTGSAAIDGIKNCAHADIVILYPDGRTSDVQRRQMTTVDSPNVHVVAVDGSFDDCQDLVKAMFNDTAFRDRMNLSAVNSINWARVMAQVVYYVTATDHLRGDVNFCVPSGNFGNVFSGWIAKQMGAPIDRLVVASNANDILTRFFTDNDMSTRPVVPSLSPSMDIQVSSNFERLLFEINGRDGGMTAEQLQRFRASGSLSIEADQRAAYVDGVFTAARLDDDETIDVIRRTYETTGMLIDPHTAVAVGAVERAAVVDRRTDRHVGHRAPGQVPRRRRARHRHPAAASGAPRRSDGPTRVHHASSERSRARSSSSSSRPRCSELPSARLGDHIDFALPTDIAELTPAYLTDALRHGGHLANGSVSSVDASPLGAGVGFVGQLARLQLDLRR